MSILFKVDSKEGEESLWISEISEIELNELMPVIETIKQNNGYFPNLNENIKPTVIDLYGNLPGFKHMKGRLPTPTNGFLRIEEVKLFEDKYQTIYM